MTNLFLRKWRYRNLFNVFPLFKFNKLAKGLKISKIAKVSKILKVLKNSGAGLFLPVSAFAVGNLPFNTALDEFKASFISATFDIAIILMMATCLMLAFGEWSDGIKRFINIVFFISLALAAPTGIVLLFGTGGY